MGMGKFYSLPHISPGKVFRFRPQSKDFSADVYGICAELDGNLQNLKTAGGYQ
jgi:hypothetical protein